MRTVRFEKEEVMGEFRGQDALGKLLSKALGRAVRDIPLPNCNTGAINYFLKNIYGRITWKRITGAVSITGTVSGDTVKEAVPRPKRVRSTFKDRREKKRLAGLVAGEKVTVPVTPGGGANTHTGDKGLHDKGLHDKGPPRQEKGDEEKKLEVCAGHTASLLGVKHSNGEVMKCKVPACVRKHVSDLKQVTRTEAAQVFAFIKGYTGTLGSSAVKSAQKGTFKGE